MCIFKVSIIKLLLIVATIFRTTIFAQNLAKSTNAFDRDDAVKVVSGTKVKRFERLTVALNGNLLHPVFGLSYGVLTPRWQAGAHMAGEGESAIDGRVTFQQLPYNNDVRVSMNITGLPVGKHAVHIHTFGDVSQGCKSTGGQFPNNFIGNIDTKEDGSVSAAFISYLTLFGLNGIIGRSIVIHEKPIDLNIALNAEVFSSSLHLMPDTYQAYQNEENSVGPAVACGVISIMSTEMIPTPAPELPRK